MEIMTQHNRYDLDFLPTWDYVFNSIKNVNILSIALLKFLNFKTGQFFTLLPEDSNFEMLYQFKTGLILPQFPMEKQVVNGETIAFSRIPNVEKELSELLFKEIKFHPKFNLIFDIVNGTASSEVAEYYYELHPLFFNEEVYFLLNNKNISLENIATCLDESLSFWHSLCVITSADLNDLERNLTEEKIQEVCLNVELVIVGAYDGEGYIFWEKNSSKEKSGFFSHTLSQG
jgi:hypothetical protein